MKVDWPFVTIGLRVKNDEKTVGEAIKTIVNAGYPLDKMDVLLIACSEIEPWK